MELRLFLNFSCSNMASKKGKRQQHRCSQPSAKAYGSWHVHAKGNTGANKNCAQTSKLPHAIHEYEGEVMCPQYDHESRVEPCVSKYRNPNHNRQSKGKGKRDLNAQCVHGVSLWEGISMPHGAQ